MENPHDSNQESKEHDSLPEQKVEGEAGEHLAELQRELQEESYRPVENQQSFRKKAPTGTIAMGTDIPEESHKKGLSISLKISGSIALLVLIIILVAATSLLNMSTMSESLETIANQALVLARNNTRMRELVYQILINQTYYTESHYLETDEEQYLNLILQDLQKLSELWQESIEAARKTEQHGETSLTTELENVKRMIDDYKKVSDNQGKFIQIVTKQLAENKATTTKYQNDLAKELEKLQEAIGTTTENYWLLVKKQKSDVSAQVVVGRLLDEIAALLVKIQLQKAYFTASNEQIQVTTTQVYVAKILETADNIRNRSEDEQILAVVDKTKLGMRNYLALFNSYANFVTTSQRQRLENRQKVEINQKALTEKGDELLYALRALISRNWELVATHKRQVDELASNSAMILWSVAGFGAMAGLFVLIFIPRPITYSIAQLLKSSSAIARGDLTSTVRVTASDELGNLAQMMEKMRGSLLFLIGEISEATVNITSMTNEVMASSTQQSSSSAEIYSQVNEASSSVNQHAASLSELKQSLAGVNEFSINSTTKSRESVERAQVALSGMNNISQSNARASERIQLLREKIEEIGKVLGVISEVADQTNMLSLNASIEATKAGEAGKGFTVVATEIRRLADRSMLAARNVNDIVHDIQRAAESAVMSMQKSSEEIRVGSEAVNVAMANLEDIAASIEQISSQTRDMFSVIDQQAEGSRIIGESMQNISTAVAMSTSATKQISLAISDLNSLVNQLRRAVTRFTI